MNIPGKSVTAAVANVVRALPDAARWVSLVQAGRTNPTVRTAKAVMENEFEVAAPNIGKPRHTLLRPLATAQKRDKLVATNPDVRKAVGNYLHAFGAAMDTRARHRGMSLDQNQRLILDVMLAQKPKAP